MIFFGDGGDHVHHIRHAAGALAADFDGPVNLCRDYDFPRVLAQKGNDDFLYLAVRYDVALAHEHATLNASQKVNVNVTIAAGWDDCLPVSDACNSHGDGTRGNDRVMALAARRRLAVAEIVLLAVALYFVALKLLFVFGAAPLTDEAYYWMWGRHPALSYFDHPPLGAWVQTVFHALLGTNLLALRLPTLLATGGILWIIFDVARRVDPDGWRLLFLKSSVVYLASPLLGFFGTVAMLDYLLVVLLMVSGYFFVRYFADVEETGHARLPHLLAAAVLLGLAGLTKYTAVFLAFAVVGAVVARPKLRPLLVRPQLYLASLVTLTLQAPVVVWNLQHGFASFEYQLAGRYVGAHFTGVNFAGMKTFVVETAALVSPFVLVPATLLFFWARQRNLFERVGKTLAIWLFCVASLTFLYIANFSGVLWWWNAVAFALIMPFAGRYIGPVALALHVVWGGAITTFLAVSFSIVPIGNYVGGLLTMETDYSYGWSDLAQAVVGAQATTGAQFLVVNRFQSASQLAFVLDDPDVVAIAPSRDAFDDWFPAAVHAGEDAIVLVVRRDDTEYWKDYFRSAVKLREVTTERFGMPIATYEIWHARGFMPP